MMWYRARRMNASAGWDPWSNWTEGQYWNVAFLGDHPRQVQVEARADDPAPFEPGMYRNLVAVPSANHHNLGHEVRWFMEEPPSGTAFAIWERVG